ncbi:FHA domain-containing protein [Aquincola sp. MAHUQ-54]|uniref:FHA domain-containing protein n=1 Tax=Aquincola agrisoli TaxID=3119538 RepID=A0AAW9QFH8_9BURK
MAAAEARLALIEVFDRDGRLLRQHDVVAWPASIGRGLDCSIVLDDPHVAARHAWIEADGDNRLWLVAGPSVNGVWAGRRRLRDGARMPLDEARGGWQIGLTRVRVRLAGDVLAPEQPLAGSAAGRRRALATTGYALALWAMLLGEHWVRLDPGSRPSDWLSVVFAPPLALSLWSALWALASKLFRHRFDFESHWALSVRFAFGLTLAGTVLPLAAAALAWPGLFRWIDPLMAVGAVAWLVCHAALVLPQRRRTLTAMAAGMLAAAGAVGMTLRHQNEAPWVGPLYMSVLPQPGWRLARPVESSAFVESTGSLRATLDARAHDEPDEPDEAEPAESE